jgi:hypothetical protein
VERVAKEVKRIGKEVLEVGGIVRTRGVLNGEEVGRILEECHAIEDWPKKIVVGGPGNSLVRHGEPGRRGMKAERTLVLKKSYNGEDSLSSRYHLTEPVRVTRAERTELIRQTVRLIMGLNDIWPGAEIIYIGLYPRHVERCCNNRTHMTLEDTITMGSNRRDLDNDIVDELTGGVGGFRYYPWYMQLSMDQDMTVTQINARRIMDSDGVHLNPNSNRAAAVYLCHRLADTEIVPVGGQDKRPRF